MGSGDAYGNMVTAVLRTSVIVAIDGQCCFVVVLSVISIELIVSS